MEDSGAAWDGKYEAGLPSLTRPDPFFLSAYERFVLPRFAIGGAGLDLAGGLGRHAIWLARRAWKMSVVDISEVALGKLRERARPLDIRIDLFVMDAAEYDLRPAEYDLVVLFYHFDRRLFTRIVASLNPGGLFVCKLALPWRSETDASSAVDSPLRRGEMVHLVPGLDVVEHRERPVRDRGVVEFVGRKPEDFTPQVGWQRR